MSFYDAKIDIAKRRLFVQEKLEEFEKETDLSEVLDTKLRNSGWNELMKNYAKGIIRQEGLDSVQVDQLEERMMVKGKNCVPVEIRDEILHEIVKMLREEGLIPKEKRYKEVLDA